MSTKLEEARAFEAKFLNIKDDSKPDFHAVVPVGWMNDPNGFSEYKNEYHLFSQYFPYDTKWGPMHWGHFKTKDFIKWEHLPVIMAPENEYDLSGCYSGTAIEDGDTHLIAYTGVLYEGVGEAEVCTQVQCLATGDGLNYKKMEYNPVITADMITEPVSQADFRDPKIWKQEGKYYLIAAVANPNGLGRIALFEATDLERWTYKGMMARNDGEYGTMWECPDYFKLDNKDVLIVSAVEMKKAGKGMFDGHYCIYFIDEWDGGEFKNKNALGLDYGFDFYAPQSLLTSDGRRVMIAWMQKWDKPALPKIFNWNGAMTTPRELSLVDGRLVQRPVRELEKYRENEVCYNELDMSGEMELNGIEGRVIDLEIEVLGGDYRSLEIQFAKNDRYRTVCRYGNGKLLFDRSKTASNDNIEMIRESVLDGTDDKVKLRILLDKYSAEIFINDGKYVFTSLFYTPLEAKDIRFVIDGSLKANINKYDIKI